MPIKSKDEIFLLKDTTEQLTRELSKNKDALHVRMHAMDLCINKKEIVQVHILITRDESDFLDDFQMEVMNRY